MERRKKSYLLIRKIQPNKKPFMRKQNAGFSLIELVASIAIIAILAIPFLNSFITAAKVNKRMSLLRNVNVMSENLMEGLKSLDIGDTIEEFAVTDLSSFHLLPLEVDGKRNADGVIRLEPDGIGHTEYTGPLLAEDMNGTYCFGIDGVMIQGKPYDLKIDMDGSSYKSADKAYQPNEYKMPILNNIDDSKVALIDTMAKGGGITFDEKAIEEFVRRRNVFVCQPGNETKTSYSTDEIRSYISKECRVTIKDVDTMNYRVTATLTYTLDGDRYPITEYLTGGYHAQDQIASYTVYDKQLELPLDCTCIFYTPSVYQYQRERIILENERRDASGRAKPVKVYLAYQDDTGLLSDRESASQNLRLEKSFDDKITVFTNLIGTSLNRTGFAQEDIRFELADYEEAKNRIYQIKIGVYEFEALRANKYQNLNYSLESSRTE